MAALTVTLVANRRLTRTVARFKRRERVIELGLRFFEQPAKHEEILSHEFAHAAVAFVHGPSPRPHGPEWRRYVSLAGFEPAARATRSVPSAGVTVRRRAVAKAAVYVHRCPVCQMVRRAKRPVPQWRCAACVAAGLPGVLVIERLPAP